MRRWSGLSGRQGSSSFWKSKLGLASLAAGLIPTPKMRPVMIQTVSIDDPP